MPAYLPAAMDALVWTAPGCLEMQSLPVPTPAPDEVLLEVASVGICGSELSGYLGHSSLRTPPLVMGHEFSARIAQIGGGALANGAAPTICLRVAVNPLIHCGVCSLCRAGSDQPLLSPPQHRRAPCWAPLRATSSHRLPNVGRCPMRSMTSPCRPVEPLACAVPAVRSCAVAGRPAHC